MALVCYGFADQTSGSPGKLAWNGVTRSKARHRLPSGHSTWRKLSHPRSTSSRNFSIYVLKRSDPGLWNNIFTSLHPAPACPISGDCSSRSCMCTGQQVHCLTLDVAPPRTKPLHWFVKSKPSPRRSLGRPWLLHNLHQPLLLRDDTQLKYAWRGLLRSQIIPFSPQTIRCVKEDVREGFLGPRRIDVVSEVSVFRRPRLLLLQCYYRRQLSTRT